MFLKTHTSKIQNEDAAGYSKDFWFVLDGASPLRKTADQQSSAARFVELLKEELMNHLSDPLPLEQIVIDAIRQCRSRLNPLFLQDSPSTTCAIVRKRKGRLEFFSLGDSPIYIQTNTEVIRVCDESIAKLDGQVIALMQSLSKDDPSSYLSKRSHPDVCQLLEHNRSLKNTTQGYWIVDLSDRWIGHGAAGSLPCHSVQAIALMSDGFEQYRDFLHLDSKTFMQMIVQTPAACFQHLARLQAQDAVCMALPRLKISDDTTLLVKTF